MNRTELAHYLRTRRAKLLPHHVGMPLGPNRRTPGLRRQEVAQLANMSIDYYIRLEQGRGPKPSRQVLNALSRALLLNQDERAHLFHLADQTPQPGARPDRDVPAGVSHLLECMVDTPAYVVDAKYDLLAVNPLAAELLAPRNHASPCGQANMLRTMFGDGGAYLRAPDRLRFARSAVADVRASAARYPDDPALHELIDELLRSSPEFAAIWAEHEVEVRRHLVKRIHHPQVGELDLQCQVLLVPDRDQRIIMYVAEPGSITHQRLRDLVRQVA